MSCRKMGYFWISLLNFMVCPERFESQNGSRTWDSRHSWYLSSDWSMLIEFLEDLQKHVCKILGLWILYFGLYQMYIKCIAFMNFSGFAYVWDINYLHLIAGGWPTKTPLVSSASRSREDKTRTRGGHSGRCETQKERPWFFLLFPAPSFPISRLGMNPTSKRFPREKLKFVVQNFSMVLRKRFFVFCWQFSFF